MKSTSTLIDAGQAETRTLVEQLHAHADTCEQVARQSKIDDKYNPIFWETLAAALTDAACILDDYQSGFRVATPNHCTGLELHDAPAYRGTGIVSGVLAGEPLEEQPAELTVTRVATLYECTASGPKPVLTLPLDAPEELGDAA